MVKKLGISVVFAILVGGVLLTAQQALGLEMVITPRPGFLLAAIATHFLSLMLIATRLHLSLAGRNRQPYVSFLDMTVLHNFLLAFLPARLADAYYPFLVAARSRGSVGAGVGNLILLRLLDLAAIGVLATTSLPWVVMDGLEIDALIGLLALALGGAFGLIMILVPVLTGTLSSFRRVARRIALAGKLYCLLNQARRWLSTQSFTNRLILFVASLALWSSSALTYFIIFRGLGLDFDLPRSIFAGQLTELGAVLPVQTVAGLGAGEGVLTAVLVGYGLPLARAAVTAIWCRLSILGAIMVLFAARGGVLVLRSRYNQQSDTRSTSLQSLLFGQAGGFLVDNSTVKNEANGTLITRKPLS